MKRKFLLIVCFPLFHLVLTSSGGGATPPWEKENVSFLMMNLEIKATVKENERQKEIKQNQTLGAGVESINQTQWKGYKEKVTKIQDRLRIVSFAVQSIPTGIAINREITKIINNQTAIINEINTAPYSIILLLPSQIQYVDDLQMVMRLITGIIISYGAINQMEKSERQILLDYALGEVKSLSKGSTHMLVKIRDIKAKVKNNKRTFEYYINKDRHIVKDIINNIKKF